MLVILGDHDIETHSKATQGTLGSRNGLDEQVIEIEYGETDPKWNGKFTDIIRIIHIQMYFPAHIVLLISFLCVHIRTH